MIILPIKAEWKNKIRMELIKEEIIKQQDELQFTKFDHEDGIRLGILMYETAKAQKLPVVVEISRFKQQVFHIALPGTSHDNDAWLKRKENTVYHYGKSSMLIQIATQKNGKTIEEMSHISSRKYAAAGGAFPIMVKNVGLVGVAAVSGMTSEEDHILAADCIRKFLKEQ